MSVSDKGNRRGKHDYSKRHACIFCGKLVPKIARHLCSKAHENEEMIARLPPPSKKGSPLQLKREHMLDALRNEGDFIHNIGILKYGNSEQRLIVAHRPTEGIHTADDYLPCKFCLRFYVKTELWRHARRCQFSPEPLSGESLGLNEDEKTSRQFMKSSALLMRGAGVCLNKTDQEDEEFHFYVLEALQDDAVAQSIKKDPGLIVYGKNEFERLGKRRANEVRYRMRLLERIKAVVKSVCQSDSSSNLEELITPDKFPFFVQAVRTVVGVSAERSLNGVIMFNKPELARKIGQMIRKFAEMCEGRAVVRGNREARQNVTDFLFLYSTQWSAKIGSLAHQTAVEKKFNKKIALPLTEDLQKVQRFLDTEIVKQDEMLQSNPSAKTWKEFAKVLLTKLTLFNFRRGNECSAMQITKFLQRDDWRSGNQEIYKSLSSFERELAQR